jgi:aldehyde dehydrogenase (NAD+)
MFINVFQIVVALRRTFKTGKTLPIEYRIGQLNAMKSMLEENCDRWCEALYKDLHRVGVLACPTVTLRFVQPKLEAKMFEVQLALNEINTTLKELPEWMRAKKVRCVSHNQVDVSSE